MNCCSIISASLGSFFSWLNLVLKRGWLRQSLYRWFLGLCVAVFGFWQICLGILEGGFYDMYLAGATNQLSLSYCIGYSSAALGAILYLVFMPGLKELMAKERGRWEEV